MTHYISDAEVLNRTDEGLKKRILKLLPSHSTVEGLRETMELRGVSKDEIYTALHSLQEEGKVTTGDLLGRTRPKAAETGKADQASKGSR